MFLKILLTVAIMACTLMPASGQRTTRSNLKTAKTHTAVKSVIIGDTLSADTLDVSISGYEKTLRSTVESMFATNNTARRINGMNITIDYYDAKGRQLHQRNETIKIDIPAFQTRMIKIPTWDKQKVWYYRLSERTRTKSQATPYDIKATVNYIISQE